MRSGQVSEKKSELLDVNRILKEKKVRIVRYIYIYIYTIYTLYIYIYLDIYSQMCEKARIVRSQLPFHIFIPCQK